MRAILLSRGSNTIRELAERTEPWAMFGIGPYTLAPFRVTWKRMASDMVAAVMGQWGTPYGAKPIIPTETTAFIPVDDEAEAHFLAAILNSVPIRLYIRTFSAPGRGFGAPAILNHIALPRFDPSLKEHHDLSELGRRAAHLAALGTATSRQELVVTEGLVDAAVAILFGIGQADLSAMRKTGLATRGLTLS
jgi:hypothetical protein